MGTFFRRVGLLMGKEFRQLIRDRVMLPILFVMPVMQLIMFGYVVGADIRDLPTAVLDQDGSQASRDVTRAFEGSGYFEVLYHPANESQMATLMDGGRAGVAVIVPRGFGRMVAERRPSRVEIVVDGSESKTAQIATGYSSRILADLSRRLYGIPDNGPGVDARVRVVYNPSLRSVNAMVPGLLAVIVLLSTTVLMSQAIVREREDGTLEQLFVTPIRRSEYLFGKIVPYVLVAVVQVTLVFVVGTLWFQVPFAGSILVLAAGTFLFLLTGLGLGLFISAVSHTRQQAQQSVVFLLIPSMVLSGFIFPIEAMPAPIQALTYFIPLRYVLVVLRSSFMKGSGFAELWPQFAAMAAFSVAIFFAALARFRKRLAD